MSDMNQIRFAVVERSDAVLKKLHLKRNPTDRFALCGIWPDRSFVLMAANSRQSAGEVCRTCINVATASLARKDGSTAVPLSPQHSG
jgi:hypothetical protein